MLVLIIQEVPKHDQVSILQNIKCHYRYQLIIFPLTVRMITYGQRKKNSIIYSSTNAPSRLKSVGGQGPLFGLVLG